MIIVRYTGPDERYVPALDRTITPGEEVQVPRELAELLVEQPMFEHIPQRRGAGAAADAGERAGKTVETR